MNSEAEHGQAGEAVIHHRQVLGRAPRLVAGDRGVYSADTEEVLTEAGVKLVAIPAAGRLSSAAGASSGVIGGVQVSKAGLRACGGITGGAKAATTGLTAWNAGLAWGS